MLCILYEGAADNPVEQTIRVVKAKNLEDAQRKHPSAIMVQAYQKPRFQPGLDLRALQTPQPVWGK